MTKGFKIFTPRLSKGKTISQSSNSRLEISSEYDRHTKQKYLASLHLCIFASKCAFTLAEVLITLSIIGVVAVLTISPLITSYKEKAAVVKVKKFYTDINNAFGLAEIREGKVQYWGWENFSNAEQVKNKIKPYLNVAKDCSDSTGCFADVTYKYLNGNDWANFDTVSGPSISKLRLSNGISLLFEAQHENCSGDSSEEEDVPKELKNICGLIDVDINGDEGPNEAGKDLFVFIVTKYGIVPFGIRGMVDIYSLENACKYGTSSANNGLSCTAWVVQKDNMDYLRRQVSWDE